jgi:hypothetical protein
MNERTNDFVIIDFMVQNKIRSGGSPPFLGLVPVEESLYEKALINARNFLRRDHNRIRDLFHKYPYAAAWLIAKTLNIEYGDHDHAVYEHIEKALGVSLPAQGPARKTLFEAFSKVCIKLGLPVAYTDKFVDTYMSQAGVSISQAHHVIEAFIRQERAFGPPPIDSTAILNRWEDDALYFLHPGIVRPRRALEVDETGYHALLFARIRNDANFQSEIPFETEFSKLLEEAEKAGPSYSRTGSEVVPKPRLLWLNNSLVLLVPRQEGKLQLWLDGSSRTLRFRGGDEWVLPQPWPRQLSWKAGEHRGEISFLDDTEAFAIFDLTTGHLIRECSHADRSVEVDATNVVVISRTNFSISGQPAVNTQLESWISYTNLEDRVTGLSIAGREVSLHLRARRRISLEIEPLIRGSKGGLLNLGAEFRIETGRLLAEKRWIRITIGEHVIGRKLGFSEEGVTHFCLDDVVDEHPELKSLSPSRLRIELMAPDVKDVSPSSGTAGLTFGGWIWPSYSGTLNCRVFHSSTPPINLSIDHCKHIVLDDAKNVCLDPIGGYDFALLTFEIGGEQVAFKWPWPDVSVSRIRGDGSNSYLPYGSKIIIGDEDRFDSIIISCPDQTAQLSVRGKVEQNPFYRGMRRSLSLRELATVSSDDRVLLRKSDGTELLLFQVVSKTSPEKFSIRDSKSGIAVKFQLPQMVDAIQLEIEDELGTLSTAELALSHYPVDNPTPAWLKGGISEADATEVTLEIDRSQYEGRYSLARILVRQIGKDSWHPLRAQRGDLYAFCLKGSLSEDFELLSTSELALRYKTTYKWLSDCYAQASWDAIGKPLMARWEFLSRRLFDRPSGKKELVASAILPSSEYVSDTWIPLVHPVQIIEDMYSCDPESFSPLDVSENPGEQELSFVDKISSTQIRNLFQTGHLHQSVVVGFSNFAQAHATGEKLEGFNISGYFHFLQDPSFDNDPTAGWFWNAKPLLGPAHWRNAHLRFVERLEDFDFFTGDELEEGNNSARELSLQRFMNECWNVAEIKPPVPKRHVTDEEQNSIDVWAFAALSEIARASRFGSMRELLENLSPRLGAGHRRLLGDVSLLIRLAPEAFAFFMLAWHMAKERA